MHIPNLHSPLLMAPMMGSSSIAASAGTATDTISLSYFDVSRLLRAQPLLLLLLLPPPGCGCAMTPPAAAPQQGGSLR